MNEPSKVRSARSTQATGAQPSRAVRLRPDPVLRRPRRLLRAAPGVRQCRRSDGRRAARAFRSGRPLGARCPVATLGADRRHLRPGEPQARLLSLDGIPDRALARQQHHQSPARSLRQRQSPSRRTSTGSNCRAGARRRAGQRRAGTPGGLLSRFHGHHAAAGDGLWAALRIRHLQTAHPGRLAAGTAGQLAAPPGPLGGGRPHEKIEVRVQLLVRGARRELCSPVPAGPPN